MWHRMRNRAAAAACLGVLPSSPPSAPTNVITYVLLMCGQCFLFGSFVGLGGVTHRVQVLCVAKMAYDSRNDAHSRMMTTIYKGITGSEFIGTTSSWETVGASSAHVTVFPMLMSESSRCVGFQRTDFTTDLRGGGLLGPLQMLYFLGTRGHVFAALRPKPVSCAEQHRDFVQRLYKLSQSDTQNFPLMIQSIQITARCMNVRARPCTELHNLKTPAFRSPWRARRCVQALRQGKLNSLANATGNTVTAFHEVHAACTASNAFCRS